MGTTRTGGSRSDGGGGDGSSTARVNAGPSNVPRTLASGNPATLASSMRNNPNGSVMDTPHLPARGGPGLSNLRRSSRNAPTPSRERCPTRPENVMTPSSGRQQKGAVEEAHLAVPEMIKNSASNSPSKDSNRTSSSANSSKKGAEDQMNVHDDRIGNVRSPSKKQKRMDSRSYIDLFTPRMNVTATDVVLATPYRMGKENTFSRHVADGNIAMICDGGRLIEKNKRHSSDAVCKVSGSPICGLHETSKVQPHKLSDTCLQNRTVESSLAVEARDWSISPARQSCLPSLQSVPISPIHYEEPKSTLGVCEPISIQKEDSASRQFKVTPSDETDGNSNICVACGTPGTLRSCDGKGCKRRYHISCLDPSLEYLSPGIWFCTSCTKKRFQFGLHSIIDGIESVWDVKEAEGMQNGRQYFVKYKDLAHVHNRWVPEGDIITDTPGGPDLLSSFNKRNPTEKTIWKQEWTEPHRLLRKRLLMPPKLADDFFRSAGANFPYCNVEWLVKWRGLGYDHATWELETSPYLRTREADELKKNYENHREAANQSDPTKTNKVKQSSFQKLQRLPDGCHPDFDHDHLCSINQLREFWYKSYGAVLVDDKERVIKTILFTMSVLPDVCQPFLIVTTPASLSLWEVQFNNLAPFINVVVYDGAKNNLKLIQDLEFYENGSSIMLQVLLSHPDAILEDIEPIACIGWEAVIVDYYQNSALKYLEQLKQPSTDFRVLLLSSPIKDNLPEYMKLLAFLDSGEQENNNYVDTANALVTSKARFTRHIAYERQADSSNLLEHWVPAYISQVQLQSYCSILLSNSSVLQSQMTTDSAGALSDILLSLSKCCNHPYLVDKFLRNSLVNNHSLTDTTNTRVHACGKLLLLDKMLKEIRNKRLRVIILFQSGGAGGKPMGDILEDVVHHRFGPVSYERVEHGAPISRLQVAVNMFNDKTKDRFVFLIEHRACLPSIVLSSVDAIIIYSSDWNPVNDLKVLQNMKIKSQFKYVSVFRLYSPFTMEEKRLVLAKQGILIDNNIQDIMCSLSYSLISWGASFLFTRLDELQKDNYASTSSERDTHFMDKVISEFLRKLPTYIEDSTKINSASISKANLSGKFYSRSITLIGEKEGMPALDGDPSKFWLNLLDGRSPCGSYIAEPPQSSHRMLQNMEEPAKIPTEEADEARRKRRKVGKVMGSSSESLSDNSHDDTLPENCTTSSPALQPLDDTQQKLEAKNLRSTPKNLHIQLKQELSKLIKVLQLPDNVRFMAELLFEYLLKNHLVIWEPKGMLHTLNIALCWHAASLLNYKVDRGESLALAEKLNYEYNEELAVLIYGKLRTLKKKFLHGAGETSSRLQLSSGEETKLSGQETSANLRNDHMLQKRELELHGNFTNGARQESSSGADQIVSEGQELISVQETHRGCHLSNDELLNMTLEKRIDLVSNIFSLREKNILFKQQLELSNLETHTHNKVIRLKDVCSLVLEHIRRSHIDEMTRNDKIKLTIQWFTMLTYAFLEHMRLQHKKLEALQSNTWSKERELKENLHQDAKSGQLDPAFDQHIAVPDSNFVMEEFIHFKEQYDEYCIVESSVQDCQQPSNDGLIMEITLTQNVVPSESISTQAVQNEPVEAFVDSGGGPASEAADFPEKGICCSSDGIGLQRACSSSTIPGDDDSIGQESSTGERRNTKLVERDNIANPSILLGDATSLVRGVNANNDGTLDADRVHLESPVLASSQSLATLSMSREVGIHANISTMSAQQTVRTLQHPHMEAEPTNTLGAIVAWDLTPQRRLATSGHLPADAETASILTTEAAQFLQPGVSGKVGARSNLSSMSPQQSTYLPAQQNVAPTWLPPAEAERTSLLGTQAVQDLQPEMQPSTLFSDAPPQRMHPDDRSQTGCQPDRATGLSQGGEATSQHLGDVRMQVKEKNDGDAAGDPVQSESPTYAAHSPATLPVSTEVETQTSQSSMPAEQSTSLPAQQSFATLRHPPAEAEPADIVGTEAARDLQPEVQPSSSIQNEPAEAERAAILGTITARDMQPEMQPSTSTQDVPFERTNLSVMPVLQSPAIHPSVEPSWDPHAGIESAGTLGMLTAHDLQSEIQPSASMQDRLAEAEGAGLLATMAAQDFQPELQSSTTVQHVPLERTHTEERSQIGFQPNIAPGPEQLTQLLPPATFVFNQPILSEEPLKNELDRFKHCSNLLIKAHEQKKSLLLIEYNQEIEKVKRKYYSLLQKEDSTYLQSNAALVDIYKKVLVNQSLAENFRGTFTSSSTAQGRATSLVMEQPLQFSSAAQTAASPVASSSAIRPPALNLFPSPRPYDPPSLVAQPSSSRAVQLQSILHGNLYGATSSPFNPAPVPHGSYGSAGAQSHGVQPQSILLGNLCRAASSPFIPTSLPHGSYGSAGAQSRALSPHLQQLRMRSRYGIHTNQQQLPAGSPGVTSSGQFVPVIMENFASTSPQAVAILNYMTRNSIHQTMSSASSSRPASSLPSGPHPELMANFEQSSSSNPIFMAAQQSSSPNMVFHGTSGPLNAAPGSWHAGAQMAGASQPGSESALFNATLPARLGLTSDRAGTGASAEAVCISDDEQQ